MTESTGNVMAIVDAVLARKELMDRPRSLLLLRLCQLSLFLAPDKAGRYWEQLAALQTKVPQDSMTNLEDVRSVMESASKSGAKGFAAEVIA